MSRKLTIGGILFTLLFSACSLDDPNKDLVITLDTDFTVSIFEDLNSPEFIGFDIQTTEMRPCLNSTIDLSSNVDGNTISLFINDVEDPYNCKEGEALAKGNFIAELSTSNSYDISLMLRGGIENIGTLEVKEESYHIEMATDDGIKVLEDTFYKIPEHIAWGYFAFNESGSAGEDVQALIDELASISESPNLKDGHYGHFIAEDDEIIWQRDLPYFNKVVSIIFKNENRMNEAINLVSEFKNNHTDVDLNTALFLWDGRRY